MSLEHFKQDVLFLQRFLKSAGFDPGPLDNQFGPLTAAAVTAFDLRTQQITEEFGKFADARTERCIQSLHPRAQSAARRFLRKLQAAGMDARIISGTRTYAEQDALFRKGRFGNPGSIVTKARGGQSNHNFGIAWDIGLFQNGAYLTHSSLYSVAAEVALDNGLEWGGHWQSFVDKPHYQLALGQTLAVVRDGFEQGLPLTA